MHKILIVEDDSVIASEVKRSLARWGFEAHTADDFSDIIGTFNRLQPHLVLMDISLPFYNGYYWCSQLRRQSKSLRGAVLDTGGLCLVYNDIKTELTRNEARILQTLLVKKGEVVSREELMLALWDSDEFVDDNTLTVNVNRLRKTLEDAGLTGCIITHKGRGYAVHD
jgi:DNA-binding response OmpR family regulator